MTGRFLSSIAMLSLLAYPAAGQVTFQVVDSQGRPIPAVQVDLYGTAELIGTFGSGPQGMVTLTSPRWTEVRRIHLSHVGFQTVIVQVDDIPVDGVVWLEPEAFELEGFTVRGQDLCPVEDSEEARQLWAEVAVLYSGGTGFRAKSAYYSRYAQSVPREDIHQPPTSEPSPVVFAQGGDPADGTLGDRVQSHGYVWPPLRTTDGAVTGIRQLGWSYPDFDRARAFHFATATFGERHHFAVVRESDGQSTLAFCGTGDGPIINGLVTLVPGDSFVSAEWRFHTADPDEEAGGSVSFSSYLDPAAVRHLVASRGLFYRRSASAPPDGAATRFVRLVSAGQRWYIHPISDHPCTGGLTTSRGPARTAEGSEFRECVAQHTWGGQ
jgi:hypothetical protein